MDAGALARRSVEVILDGQAPSGAYVASPTFSAYRGYCWFRDGSFIADAMSRTGEVESAEAFFEWCARVVDRHAGSGELHARYTLDGEIDESDWPHFQLDGLGTWVWALREHARRHRRDVRRFAGAVDATCEYLGERWSRPCVDWWEEREGVHPATLACLYGGLAAWERPEADEIWLGVDGADWRLDASLLACMTPFELLAVDDPRALEIVRGIEERLVAAGGVHRHRDDEYYGGGLWLLLTAWLGWHYARTGREREARAKLDWVAAHATADGLLPEQSQDHLLRPERYEPWVERWGDPPCPLLWSHAMFLTLAAELGETPPR